MTPTQHVYLALQSQCAQRGKGFLHSNSSLSCDISQAVRYAALLHISLILDLSVLTEAAFAFSFTFDKLVQLKGTLLCHSVCQVLWLLSVSYLCI